MFSTQPPPTPQHKLQRSSAGAQKPSTANSTKKECNTSKAANGSSMPSTRTKATPAPSPVPTQAPPAKSTPHSKPCGPNPAANSSTHCSTNSRKSTQIIMAMEKTMTMREATIQNAKDIANNINSNNLIWTTSNVIFCYENDTLDDEDFYRLTREILSIISDVNNLRDEINRIA